MITRKVAKWHEIPRTWWAELECGHEFGLYDGIGDERKEQLGDVHRCYDCECADERIARLEEQLRVAKAAMK